MNPQKPFIDLDSNRPSAKRPLELPFEKKPTKMLSVVAQPSAVSPNLRKIESAAKKVKSTEVSHEMRSLYGAIDEVENRLARRLERLQKRLSAAQQKIEFQQRCFALLLLFGLGWICLTLARPLENQLPPSSPQLQPSQINRLPLLNSYST